MKKETLEELRDALVTAIELLGHRRFETWEYDRVKTMFEAELVKVEREIEAERSKK